MGNQQGTGAPRGGSGNQGPSIVPMGVALGSSHTAAAGPPTDQSVPNAVDGAIHVDTSGNKIWARVNGQWKSAQLS